MRPTQSSLAASVALAMAVCIAHAQYSFEDLGRPLEPKPLPVGVVTGSAETGFTAWGTMLSPDGKGLVGVNTATGEMTWVDMGQWDYGSINITRAANGDLYLYTGDPGRFFRYRVAEGQLVDLGVPDQPASYTMGGAVGPDGRFYVGSYPQTRVVYVDPATDRIGSLGQMSEDLRCKYILQTAVSDDNIVYAAVGLHHAELWAVPVATGQKKQLLPEQVSSGCDRVTLLVGEDGRVYGKGAGKLFVCSAEGIKYVDAFPPERSMVQLRRAGSHYAEALTSAGQLVLKHAETGETSTVDTEFEGVSVALYCASCEWNGKIYGGGFQPANIFCYDPVTGQSADLGRHNGGRIQIYEILGLPKGLFISSYVGCSLDFYNPETNERVHIGQLIKEYDQERGLQLIVGPDEMLYLASRPSKGKLGGALTRINPEDYSYTCWRNVLPDQSIISVVSVPQTDEVFCTTSNYGGSGSVPTQTDGYILLWDCAGEKVNWTATPIEGSNSYGQAVMAETGLIYVHVWEQYLAFDPVKREVVFTGDMPVQTVHHQGIADSPAGPEGLIFGIGDDAVFAIDPSDHSARVLAHHPSLADAKGLMATADGVLYYVNGSHLWRVDMYP